MKRLIAFSILATLATVAPARADVPSTVPFSGRLVQNGTAVTGTQDLVFRIYDQQAGGTKLWEETHAAVTVDQGLVYARLGSITPIDPTMLEGTLYLEVQVGVDGAPFSPRLPIESVPYALHAGAADRIGDYTADSLQARVEGVCAGGSFITTVHDDGTVDCASAPAAPTYTGASGIAVSGTQIGLSSAGCNPGDLWKWNGTSWSCDPDLDTDTNTTYSVAAPLAENGTTIGLSTSGCSAGDVWKWNGSAWSCDPDVDTNTTYSVAAPLAESGTTISLSTTGCSAGDVWKWNGSAWSCDPDADTNTTYSAGSGIAIAGSTVALSSGGCAAGSVWKWSGSAWACVADADTTYAGAGPIGVAGTTISLSSTGCAAGSVWKWNGSAWACVADADTLYSGSSPISVSGTTIAMTACPANQIYKMNAAGTAFACAADDSTTYTAGQGIAVTGNTISLSSTGCAAGYVEKYNGSAWSCQPDGTPGVGTFYNAGALRPNGAGQVAHVTVNAPTNGYLMATLSYGLAVKTNSTACHVPLKISLTSGDLASGEGFQDYFWPNTMQTMDGSTAYGTFPSSITAAFPITAGSRTVYFNSGQIGAPNCADFLWTNTTLSVMFVPNGIATSTGAP